MKKYKYIILDFGNVLAYPVSGHWFMTKKFMELIDVETIGYEKIDKTISKLSDILSWKAITLEEEENLFYNFYKSLFIELNYQLDDNILREIAKDITYNFKKCELYSLVEDELEQLRRGCKSLKDKVILETLFSTGCRVTELSNMRISDIDFTERTIKIIRKGGKEDYVFLNPRAYGLVCEYLQSRNDNVDALIYSNRTKTNLHSGGVETVLDNITQRANINKRITPHVIRHTTATIALKRGMTIEEVSKLLGHSSIETTMIYAEVNRQNLRIDHEKYVV